MSVFDRSLVPRMLGAGSYGCVYYPPPGDCSTCKDLPHGSRQPRVCSHGVVKVMDENSANEEIELLRRVGRIDPRGHFHWRLLKVCPAPKSIDDWPVDDAGRPCPNDLGPNPKLLYFPYGGRPFTDLVQGSDIFSLVDLLAMRRVFLGLRTFQKNGFVHADIKPANLVYVRSSHSPSLSLPFYIKFIDFSLSFSATRPSLTYATYGFWPPETILLTSHRTSSASTLKSYAKKARIKALEFATTKSPAALEAKMDSQMEDPRFSGWLDQMKTWHDSPSSLREIVRTKFDIYGLGVTLMALHTFGNFSSELRTNSRFMQGLKGLAQRAMAFDARARPSATVLYAMYKDLLSTAFSQDVLAEGTKKLGPVSIPPSIRPLSS